MSCRTSLIASWMYSVESYGMPTFIPAGTCASMSGIDLADFAHHIERICRGQHPHAHERRGLTIEPDVLLVVLGAEHDIGDLAEPDDDAALLLDHKLTKFFRRTQIRVGDEVHRNHGPFCSPERRQIVIARQSLSQRRGRDAKGGHLVRLEPNAHRKRSIAQNVCALNAADRAQLRLNDSRQIIGDLVLVQICR